MITRISGINLTNSNWNTLFNNTANSNSQNGIVLTNSSNNTLYHNTARYNQQDGILVNLSSNGNNLTENKVCGNLWNGIEVNGSTGTTLSTMKCVTTAGMVSS